MTVGAPIPDTLADRWASSVSSETLGGMLLGSVARHADQRALVFDGRSWTYAELGQATWRTARALAAIGVTKGSRVAVLMPSTADWLTAAFAAALNGAVLVPVSPLASAAERDHILRLSDAQMLLMSARSGPRDLRSEMLQAYTALAESTPDRLDSPAFPYLQRVFVQGIDAPEGRLEPWDALMKRADEVSDEVMLARAGSVTPIDDAIIFWTSGSTAAPKAVVHRHRAPVTTMTHMARFQALGERETMFGGKQFFWVGMTSTVGACLSAGACFVGMERFEPTEALALLEREHVTVVNCSTHQLDQIGRAAESSPRDLGSLRLAEPGRLARAAGLPEGHPYLIGYGMTETAGTVCSLAADAPLELRRTTNGRPLPGLEIRVVDPDTGAAQPAGQPGVVQIAGPTVMRGYLGRAPEDSIREGYLVTDDLGYIDADGYFHFVGRVNGMIKTNAANVSREEVEQVLRAWCPTHGAFVIGVPHPTLGEAVVAVLTGPGGSGFRRDRFDEFLRTRLAAYKLPKRVVFLDDSEVPRTAASDKVDYPALSARVSERLAVHDEDVEWAAHLARFIAAREGNGGGGA